MKLTPEQTAFIFNTVQTANAVDIENIIIEPKRVRGTDESITTFIIQNQNVPDMPDERSIGLSRLKTLTDRLDIARSRENFAVSANLHDGEDFIRSLTMKGKGVKIDYRCADPSKIRAPRQIKDHFEVEISISQDDITSLQKGQVAMKEEFTSIIGNDGVFFEIPDVTNDVFSLQIADEVTTLNDDANIKFAHRYLTKTLLTLFRKSGSTTFKITQTGILCIPINDLDIYVVPQV